MRFVSLLVVFLIVGLSSADAVIIYGKGNDANTTDPGVGAPFEAVARVSNNGGSSPAGSAIHLGNGYMLTADHVQNRTHVSFDGVTYYARDTSFTPVQVAPNVDLKIFRLVDVPPVPSVNLLQEPLEQVASSLMVGWGVGRDESVPVGADSVGWGGNSTIAKRWALNTPKGIVDVAYQSGSYSALVTVLGSETGTPPGLGENEGPMTLYDSGGGLFQSIGGNWYLVGLASGVQTDGTSIFGNDKTSDFHGDFNFYVRLSDYYDDIMNVVPEPEMAAVFMGGMMVMLACVRRRVRRT